MKVYANKRQKRNLKEGRKRKDRKKLNMERAKMKFRGVERVEKKHSLIRG